MTFEMVTVRCEGSVLDVVIAAPPMNLLGPELVRDRVIQQADAEETVKVLVSRAPTRLHNAAFRQRRTTDSKTAKQS